MASTFTFLAIGVVAALAGAVTVYILLLKGVIGKRREKSGGGSGTKANAESNILRTYRENFVLLPSFRAYSKKEAIQKLVESVHERFPEIVCNAAHAEEAVFAREDSMPTGLDNGIAVPHGRTDGVTQITGALAIVDNSENENGIISDYDTIDHSKIQILCLTLIPNSVNTPYLQLLAAIIRILQNSDNREALLVCKTEKEMSHFLRTLT